MYRKNLKALRAHNGHTQQFVANHLGISTHSYCNKENGKQKFILTEANKLSNLYGLTVDELFFKPLVHNKNTRREDHEN